MTLCYAFVILSGVLRFVVLVHYTLCSNLDGIGTCYLRHDICGLVQVQCCKLYVTCHALLFYHMYTHVYNYKHIVARGELAGCCRCGSRLGVRARDLRSRKPSVHRVTARVELHWQAFRRLLSAMSNSSKRRANAYLLTSSAEDHRRAPSSRGGSGTALCFLV